MRECTLPHGAFSAACPISLSILTPSAFEFMVLCVSNSFCLPVSVCACLCLCVLRRAIDQDVITRTKEDALEIVKGALL